MDRGYRVTVRHNIPSDLANRISALHAAAILHHREQSCAEETEQIHTVVEPVDAHGREIRQAPSPTGKSEA